MKWKTFGQIVLLIITATICLIIATPRYSFVSSNDRLYRGNKYTGKTNVLVVGKWRPIPLNN